MIDWIVYNKSFNLKFLPFLSSKYEINNHTLCLNEDNVYKSYVSQDKKEGVFIWGYIFPRLQFNITQDLAVTILEEVKSENFSYINNFKGNFNIICFFNNQLILFNDQFGIKKYFYYQSNNVFLASNHIKFILKNITLEVSKVNIIKYFIFNYFVDGSTIYEKCNYSKAGTYFTLSNEYKTDEYFSINDFVDKKEIKYSVKDSIIRGSELWKQIIKQYINSFEGKRISQTLTAGLDSRLILAGFRSNNYIPSTFTFGRKDSLDVIHAQKIAKKLKITHTHLYPNDDFFCDYSRKAKEVVALSSGMSSLYRAHRYDAYKRMKNSYDVLFFGFIGSEIIRGLYPDGLTVPKIISDYWLNNAIDIQKYYPKNWFSLTKNELSDLENEIKSFDFVQRPDLFLFKCMIPLHFAQDIALNESLRVSSVAPYWDLDFLEFQKNTPFFTDNNKKEKFAKMGHFRRRKGPFYSANLICQLDKKNAMMSLGKGYSPADYSFSMFYASLKFLFHKIFFRKKYKVPNFNYEKWFVEYLTIFFKENNLDFSIIDNNKIIDKIKLKTGETELDFISYVKLVNVQLIKEIANE